MSRLEGGILANEEAQEKRRARVKLGELNLHDDYRQVMDTVAGRRVLAHVIRQSGLADPIASTMLHPDPRVQDYAQGRRSLGAVVLSDMRAASLELYRVMEDEAVAAAKTGGANETR